MKTTYELAAERMLTEGAVRVEAGGAVTLRAGSRVTLLTGWGAWDEETRRLVTTGKVRVEPPTPRGL